MERIKYIVIGLLTILLTLVVAGCCYHRTPEQRAQRAVQHLITTLKLDSDQTAKLEKMKEEYLARRPDMVKMREESFNDLKEIMLSPQLDQARLNARTEKVQAHADDMIRFISTKLAELHDILTPEQRNKLVEEMEKHAKRAHRW
ncbi:MAG TPA: Spy/CpxP family protein refolding chaperone [Nitrospirota bacterium]|nr:Spy/CpxP family protein refolding chaperone [Nitrospirota bacterium]